MLSTSSPSRAARAGTALVLLGGFVSSAGTMSARTQAVPDLLRTGFEARLEEAARRAGGVLGVQVVDLVDGSKVGVNVDTVFPQASAIKVPILVEFFRRAAESPRLLAEQRRITAANRVGGSGVLLHFADGKSDVALEDLATLMIIESDNTATNILIDEVGTDSINRLLGDAGFAHTRLRRKMMRFDLAASGEENTSTPAEAAAFMTRLSTCELPLTPEACKRVREILELPKDDPFREPIPSRVKVAFKPGYTDAVRTAWAIVDLPGRPYVAAIMTTYDLDGTYGDGAALVREVSRLIYDYFQRRAFATPLGVRVPK